MEGKLVRVAIRLNSPLENADLKCMYDLPSCEKTMRFNGMIFIRYLANLSRSTLQTSTKLQTTNS